MSTKSASTQKVYQLKITLKQIRPPIWRRILVDSDIKLSLLHSIIQIVMGWYDCHLHSWNIGGIDYGEPHEEYESDLLNEKTVKLSKVIPGEKFKFYYTYDFGDSWEHEILVEKVLPPTIDTRYPVCMYSWKACLPS